MLCKSCNEAFTMKAYIGPSDKLLCLCRAEKECSTCITQHSIHVWQLVQSSCSFPFTEEFKVYLFQEAVISNYKQLIVRIETYWSKLVRFEYWNSNHKDPAYQDDESS